MGQPKCPPIREYEDLKTYAFPDPMAEGRMASVRQMRQRYPDKYLIASLGISGFNLVTFLRGFEETLVDLYTEPEQILRLTDQVMDFECGIIRRFAREGADAAGFGDDWGTQSTLMISPELWRTCFKPRYKRQFDLAHQLGMSVFFHSCGYVWDIIPDLIEIGADILNLNQPDLFGVEALGDRFAGQVCFSCPVDHQTTAVTGSDEEIDSYVRRLKKNLGKKAGARKTVSSRQ